MFFYAFNYIDDESSSTENFLEEISKLQNSTQNITGLTIKLKLNFLNLADTTLCLNYLAQELQNNHYLTQLNKVTFNIEVGYEAAEDDYDIDSSFPESIIQLLESIQNPSNVRELALHFDFPFHTNETHISRTQRFDSAIKQFTKLNTFLIYGYMIRASVPDLVKFIENSSSLTSVSVHMPQGGAPDDLAYIRTLLKTSHVQNLSIVHVTPHEYSKEQFTGYMNEIASLSLIQDVCSLKSLSIKFELGEPDFIPTQEMTNLWQKTINDFLKSCLVNLTLSSLTCCFDYEYGTDFPRLSPISFNDPLLATALKRNTSLQNLRLSNYLTPWILIPHTSGEGYILSDDPRPQALMEQITQRNKKIFRDAPSFFAMAKAVETNAIPNDSKKVAKILQVLESTPIQLSFFDEVVFNQLMPIMPAIYDMRLWDDASFIPIDQRVTFLNDRKKLLDTVLSVLLQHTHLCSKMNTDLIAQLILPYFTPTDLRLLNDMNDGLFVRTAKRLDVLSEFLQSEFSKHLPPIMDTNWLALLILPYLNLTDLRVLNRMNHGLFAKTAKKQSESSETASASCNP